MRKEPCENNKSLTVHNGICDAKYGFLQFLHIFPMQFIQTTGMISLGLEVPDESEKRTGSR